MADKKICFVIGPLGATGSDTRNRADWLYKEVIEAALADFPDYELQRAGDFLAAGRIDDQIVNAICTADIVVADLTNNNPNVLFEVGVRQATGKPMILFASHRRELPFQLRDTRYIQYLYPTDKNVIRNFLSNLLSDIIDSTRDDLAPQSATQQARRQELARRVDSIASALADLRLNSLAAYVEELREVARDLNTQQTNQQDTLMPAENLTDKVLLILAKIDQAIGSTRIGKLVISGALAGLVTGGGVSAAAVFGLSLAVWEGPDFFKDAINKYFSTKR
jgi:nucleoside 2-deoxyribosyltransferase